MENFETRIMPEEVLFRKSFIIMTESDAEKHRISYKDIVWAQLRVWDDKLESYLEPEITDITRDMDGELILYDGQHNRWVILTDRIKKKAGALMEELCIHAPYIMLGRQDWIDCSEEADYKMVEHMVGLMREYSGQ